MQICNRYFFFLLILLSPCLSTLQADSPAAIEAPAASTESLPSSTPSLLPQPTTDAAIETTATPLPPTDPTPIDIVTGNAATDVPQPKRTPIKATNMDTLRPTAETPEPPSGEISEMAVVGGTDPETAAASVLATASADNAAEMDSVDPNEAFTPAVPLEVPAPDTSTTMISPEASAAALAAGQAAKSAALEAEMKKEADKTTQAKKDEDLFAYSLTGMKEAGVDISKNGFGMTARFDLGWGAYMRATFALNTDGLLLQGYIKEIKLANLIKITGVGPDGKYGTPDDGVIVQIRLDKKVQRVMLSGLVDLFGAMCETDIIMESEKIRFMAYTNLFNMFSTTLLAEFKFTDFDFFIEGAAEAKLIAFIEKEAKEAISKVGEAVVDVSRKAERAVQKARKKIEGLKSVMRNATEKLHKAQAAYFAKLNGPQKDINAAARAVENSDKAMAEEVGKILDARRKLLAGRRAIASAVTKVNSLNGQANRAIKKLKSIARGMKWYQFWKIAELAYWSAAVAALETARGVAIGALEIAKAAIYPISGLLTATYAVSYAASKAALEAAYVGLQAALVAANPLTMEEFGHVLAASLELNTTRVAYYAGQGVLIASWATFKGIEEVTKGLTIAMKEVISAAFRIFRIDGAAFKASIKNVIQGSLDLYLLIYLFGVKKNLKLTLDITRPDKTLASIGYMIADIFNPLSHGSSDNIFAKVQQDRKDFVASISASPQPRASLAETIQQHRSRFEGDLNDLGEKNKAVLAEQDKIKKQQAEREAALKKIQEENAQRISTMRQKYPFTQDDIKNMGSLDFLSSTESATIVDEKNPVSCSTARMQGLFRWVELWKLPTPNSGCVLFNVAGNGDIYIGFHHETDEKKQKKNKDFDVILGSKGNTVNVIRSADSEVLFSSGDPDGLVLDKKEAEYQSYWVSFDNGYCAVGRGPSPGKQLLFDWQMSDLSDPIQYFSFSSGGNELSFINIHTAPSIKGSFGSQYSTCGAYNQFRWPFKLAAPNSSTITFKAKAAQNIALGMCDTPSVRFARYLAVFGAEGNTTTTMATGAPDGKAYNYQSVTEDTAALLPVNNQSTYYPYWATFNNGHFVIGSGTIPSQNIISEINVNPATLPASHAAPLTPPPAPPATASTPTPATPAPQAIATAGSTGDNGGGGGTSMQYFSFSSWDDSVEIRDIVVGPAVPCPIGTLYSAVNRKLAASWCDTWQFKTPGRGIVTWEGKGAADMGLMLHTSASTDNSYTYLCTIGAQNNTHTTLSDASKKVLVDNTDLESVISAKDSYTPYWFSYEQDGYCMLGTGSTPGQNVVLETPTPPQPITHFCFTNNTDHVEFTKIATQDITAPLVHGSQYTAAPHTPISWNSAWTIENPQEVLVILAAKAETGFCIGLKDEKNDVYTVNITPATMSIADPQNVTIASNALAQGLASDPDNFYPYWVRYTHATGALSCGAGPITSKKAITQTTLSNKPTLITFGIGNPTEAPAYCKKIASLNPHDTTIPTSYGSVLFNEAYTAANKQPAPVYKWQEAWTLSSAERGCVACRVRTAHTMTLGLGNEKDGALYEIYINNKEVTVRKGKAVVARSIDKAAILPDANNFYGYWISYHDGQLRLGTGNDPRENQLLEWVDSTPTQGVTHFSPSSAGGVVAYKAITSTTPPQAPLYEVYSACQEKKAFSWHAPWELTKPEQGLITFELKTDSEGVIGITGTKPEATYTVQLGKSCIISKNGLPLATSTKPAPVVKGNAFQPFWIIFDKGYIAVGTGLTQNNDSLLVDYQGVPTVDIMQRFSLSSDAGQATYRKISSQRFSGTALKRNTSFAANACKGSYNFSAKWSLAKPNAGTIIFDAKGPGPYKVALDSHLGTLSAPIFEIIFGSKGNTCTELYKNGVLVQAISDARGIIATQEGTSSYWIIFNQDHITIGAGAQPGTKTFLDWKDAVSTELSYFSFSSDLNKVLYSNIQCLPPAKQEKVTEYVIPANRGKYKFDPAWRIPATDFGGFMIKARGASDICMGLHTGTSGTPRYELVIGANKNSCSVLKSNGTVVASNDGSDALIRNANISDAYWILYDHGTIAAGKGETPGQDLLLYWTDTAAKKDQGITYYALAANEAMVTVTQISPSTGIKYAPNTMYSCLNRQGAPNWNPSWKIQDGQTITFDVTAPKGEVYVGFNSIPSMLARYTVVLGGWQNTTSAVMQGTSIAAKYPVTMKPITKSMWITYTKEKISVGTGEPHSKELLSWQNPKPDPYEAIGYFSLSCGSTSTLFENIKVITAGPITQPKTASTVPGIQISSVPKEAEPADDEPPVTDPSDPRYMSPTISALMKPTADETALTSPTETEDDNSEPSPATAPTAAPAAPVPQVPVLGGTSAAAEEPGKEVVIITKKDTGAPPADAAAVSAFLASMDQSTITTVTASSLDTGNLVNTLIQQAAPSTATATAPGAQTPASKMSSTPASLPAPATTATPAVAAAAA